MHLRNSLNFRFRNYNSLATAEQRVMVAYLFKSFYYLTSLVSLNSITSVILNWRLASPAELIGWDRQKGQCEVFCVFSGRMGELLSYHEHGIQVMPGVLMCLSGSDCPEPTRTFSQATDEPGKPPGGSSF